DSYSAAIQTSAASSTTFLPMWWTPASRRATVEDPSGRVRAVSVSWAKSCSKDFTLRSLPARSRSQSHTQQGVHRGRDLRDGAGLVGVDGEATRHPRVDRAQGGGCVEVVAECLAHRCDGLGGRQRDAVVEDAAPAGEALGGGLQLVGRPLPVLA